MVKIGDLITEKKFFPTFKILKANLSPIQRFKLMNSVNTIPPDWGLLIMHNHQQLSAPKTLNGIIFGKVDRKD